jgi:hypothetical protein
MGIVKNPDPNEYLSTLLTVIRRADPERTTNRELKQQINSLVLAQAEQNRARSPIINHSGEEALFLGNRELVDLIRAFQQIEQGPARQAVEFLKRTIRRRESQSDLWPEGRLQLGMAYAALGEWELARRELDEVIMICESGGRYKGQNMAMAA